MNVPEEFLPDFDLDVYYDVESFEKHYGDEIEDRAQYPSGADEESMEGHYPEPEPDRLTAFLGMVVNDCIEGR